MTEKFEAYSKEQHRQGQKAEGFPKDCRVVSADLYNSLVDKYNELLQENELIINKLLERGEGKCEAQSQQA